MLDFTQKDFQGSGRVPSLGSRGMAATSHPLATLTAVDMLRAGGNAVDAAIAACAVQCVVEPHMTAIGGDCFVLYAPKGGKIIALNGSGHAPAKATVEWFQKQGITAIDKSKSAKGRQSQSGMTGSGSYCAGRMYVSPAPSRSPASAEASQQSGPSNRRRPAAGALTRGSSRRAR